MCDYLAGLWCVEDVYCAGFDTIGFGSLVKCKPAFPPPSVSIGEWTIVPVQNKCQAIRQYCIHREVALIKKVCKSVNFFRTLLHLTFIMDVTHMTYLHFNH